MIYFTASVFALLGTMASSEAFGNDVGVANRYLSQVGFDQVGTSLFGNQPIGPDPNKFGEAVSLSSDGKHLAVGATGYDTFGAVFVYDFNEATAEWDSSTTIFGTGITTNPIGDNFELSADGSRLVVRRYDALANPVAVYDATTGAQLGATLQGCGVLGKHVTISADGNQVAMSCENDSAGRVLIYSWDNTNYVLVHTIPGGSDDELLGWAASFSGNGERLAVSSVFYHILGTAKVGQVRVYNTTSWAQIGDTPTGTQSIGRFGNAIALDFAGSTLVVGASTTTNTNSIDGAVHIYSLNGNDEWAQKGPIVTGEVADDHFGKSVAISNDGDRIAAASSSGNGEIRVFDWSSGQWNEVHEGIEGLAEGDNFGAGRHNVGMSGDGYRIASGSFNATSLTGELTGRVRVFDQDRTPSSVPSSVPSSKPSSVPSSTPSAAPSLAVSSSPSATPSLAASSAPSSSPSLSSNTSPPSTTSENIASAAPSLASQAPTASPAPSTTAAPSSTASSEFPTVTMDKFDWDLDDPLSVEIAFTGDTEEEEIKLSYHISLRTAVVKVYDEDCTTLIDSTIVGVTHETDITSSTHGQLNVTLDVKQDTVVGSPIWTDGTVTGEGTIGLCVRVDLVLDDFNQTSVNFHEQKMLLTIKLSQGFSTVTDIDLFREDADEQNSNVDVDFGLTACQCDAFAVCVTETLVQGDDVYICVTADEDNDVEINTVDNLDFVQGSFRVEAIKNGTEDALTDVLNTGKTALIRSQMRSLFFLESNPDAVVVEGDVSLIFGGIRRTLSLDSLLRGSNQGPRKTQEDAESAGFKTTLRLTTAAEQPSGNDSAGGTSKLTLIAGILGGFAGIAIIAFAFVLRKKKDDEEEDEEPADGDVMRMDLGENA